MKRKATLCILSIGFISIGFAQQKTNDTNQNPDERFGIEIDPMKIHQKAQALDLSENTNILIENLIRKQQINAQERGRMEKASMRYKRVAHAPKDGCFYGVGDPRNYYVATGLTQEQCTECEKTGGRIKTSQSYVWGLTKGADKLLWGSINNYFCTRAFDKIGGMEGGMPVTATDNSCYVCEFEEAASGNRYSDWHAPRIYSYDISSGVKTDVTPIESDEALSRTLGLRSAGSLENISFVGGPNMDNKVSLFAYDNSQPVASFLKSWALAGLPEYPTRSPYNMRRWAVANDELYFGVEWKDYTVNTTGGAILRFKKENKGDLSNPSITDPGHFFEVVGWTRGGVAEMVFMNNHLYVSTWPASTLCKSPEVGGRLAKVSSADDEKWKELFTYADYDPDLLCGMLGSGGAMAVYQDQIYFGTLNMPMMGVMFAAELYGIDLKDTKQMLATLLGTTRGCTLFRYTESDQNEKGYVVELLYGESHLPAYNMQTKQWELTSTGMTPLYGSSGFNNVMNNYCWSMNVYNDKLYIGTMDWTGSIFPRLEEMEQNNPDSKVIIDFLKTLGYGSKQLGFDLIRIDGPTQAGKVISRNGLNEETQYGIRNMINIDGTLYLGTANPYNVHDISGWELISMTEEAPYKELKIKWEPASMTYGEVLSEKQLNARVTTSLGLPVKGVYNYTINYEPVVDASRLVPANYNLRLDFMPEDQDKFDICSAKRIVNVNKSILNITGDTIMIETTDPLPESYTYKVTGFVYDDDENVLDKKPQTYVELPDPLIPGNFEVTLNGAESKLYDFNYKNGQLIVKLPTAINQEIENKVSIYPIPFRGVITLQSEASVLSVSLTDVAGNQVFHKINPDSSLDLSFLPEAIYIMKIETEHGVFVRKVSKMK
ncbi:MAG: T9SS type A sorting domain-containing protein [Bacteroidales bacterium]